MGRKRGACRADKLSDKDNKMLDVTNSIIADLSNFSCSFVEYFNAHMFLGIAAFLLCGSCALIKLHAR
jgi:hypothetical protein